MATFKVTHQTAGLLNQQNTGGHVVIVQADLPERIQTPGSNIGQVQRCRTGAANTGGITEQGTHHVQIVVQMINAWLHKRNAGADQCAIQRSAITNTDTLAVQRGAVTTAGAVLFLFQRVENHRVLKTTTVLNSNGHGKMRNAIDKVGGAIERINDPEVIFAFTLTFTVAALFTVKTVVGVGFAQRSNDGFLSSLVHFGDKVIAALDLNIDVVKIVVGSGYDITSLARRTQRHINHRLHKLNYI